MNLPVVLDVAIGLVFIYLIASLLASEIQELIATLLQWRAKHLRESIENLLSGGHNPDESDKLFTFVESLYEDPLIKNMNQEAQGLIGQLGGWIYRVLYGQRRIFGAQKSGPSYIASEVFATALLDRLGLSMLIDKLTEARLEKFATRITGLYEEMAQSIHIPDESFFETKDNWENGSIRLLAEKAKKLGHDQNLPMSNNPVLVLGSNNEDFKALVEDYVDSVNDFKTGETDLETAVDRMREALEVYIHQVEEAIAVQSAMSATPDDPNFIPLASSHVSQLPMTPLSAIEKKRLTYFYQRLESLKSNTFGLKSERAILSGRLQPSLQEIAQVFDTTSSIYLEIVAAYRDVALAYEAGKAPEKIQPLLEKIQTTIRTNSSGGNQELQLNEVSGVPRNLADLLTNAQYQQALSQAVESLDPSDRASFEGWRTYHQIILKVIRELAMALQQEQQLLVKQQFFTRSLTTLTTAELVQAVEQSLNQITAEKRQLFMNQALKQLSPSDRQVFRNYETYSDLQKILQQVPNSVKQSLAILARRVQTTTTQAHNQIEQFNQEVSIWFDRSMSRASGVYKRNAKGVAILIGCFIAIFSNADTFHIVSRLADDEDLRNIITQRAAEITEQRQAAGPITTQADLRTIKRDADAVLQEISFPIRWTPDNLREQFNCPAQAEADLNNWQQFYQDCLSDHAIQTEQLNLIQIGQIASTRVIDTGRLLFGWLISGIAIAMGAPFWFDLLSKVMNVRNTGAKPSAAADQTKPVAKQS